MPIERKVLVQDDTAAIQACFDLVSNAHLALDIARSMTFALRVVAAVHCARFLGTTLAIRLRLLPAGSRQ